MTSKYLFFFLVVHFLSDFSYGQNDGKFFRDYTYIESEESFYKIHRTEKTFADAKRTCALEGASLFYAEDLNEANAVISFWKTTQPDIPWVTVGLTDIMAEGFFETVDGRPITEVYSKWYRFQPENLGGNENCVHMDLQRSMNDYRCDIKSYFICKKSNKILERNSNCTLPHLDADGQINQESFQEDYIFIKAVGSFYKIYTTPRNWRDAKRACAQEGARLFYPDNSDEVNAVISYWKLHQNNTPADDTWVYVGISDIITEGEFETIDGKSISEIYNHWKLNQPDNSFNADCLNLNQKGELNDVRCEAEYSFICKKNPPPQERNCSCDIQPSNLDNQKVEKLFRKDFTYIESEESFYKVHTTARTFADAKRMCALEGASLFYAENVDEANAVISFWNKIQPNIPWVFVGLSDIEVEGSFETVDGRPIGEVYSKWYPNQPENLGGNEDCVHMDQQRTMNDYLCDSKANFICKKSIHQSLGWNNDCSMPNLDYIFHKDIGKCYKLHTTPMNWTKAYEMCRIEYASLAVINNKMEAEYLANLMVPTSKPQVNEHYQRGIYHLGFHNRFNEGWQTARGTPMNVDAEAWFDNCQPEGNLHEECGSMFFNGQLINTDCNMKSMFICEHEVDCSDSPKEYENIF